LTDLEKEFLSCLSSVYMEGVGQKEVWRGHMLEPHLREEQIGERINEAK
jgi:hypothetical protein